MGSKQIKMKLYNSQKFKYIYFFGKKSIKTNDFLKNMIFFKKIIAYLCALVQYNKKYLSVKKIAERIICCVNGDAAWKISLGNIKFDKEKVGRDERANSKQALRSQF